MNDGRMVYAEWWLGWGIKIGVVGHSVGDGCGYWNTVYGIYATLPPLVTAIIILDTI